MTPPRGITSRFFRYPVTHFFLCGATLAGLLCGALWVYADEGLQPPPSAPHGMHHQHAALSKGAGKDDAIMNMSIPDVVVSNQDGQKLHFYADLVKDRVVAINFIFTTCTTICPPLAATFAKVQNLLSDRVGKDFSLISISVDPVTDTPERLKAWGAKFQAQPGWTFVTGEKLEINKLLRALNTSTAQPEDHTPILLVGNDAADVWTRTYGLAPPAKVATLIEDMINTSATASSAQE